MFLRFYHFSISFLAKSCYNLHSMHLYVMSKFLTKSCFITEKVVIICCQLFEMNVFHGVRGGGVTWKFGNFRLIWKGWIEKICYFRGTQNLSGELWPSRRPCIWKISHSLYDNQYDGWIRFDIMIFENGESFGVLC